MAGEDQDLKIRVSEEGVDQAASAFSRLSNSMGQSVAFVQMMARQTRDLASEQSQQQKTTGGLIESLKGLHHAYEQGELSGGNFSSVLALIRSGAGALLSPLGLAALAIGALVAAMHKAAQEALAMYEEMRKLVAVSGLTAEKAEDLQDVFKLAGVDAGTLTMALYRLGIQIESGGEELQRLGISTRTATGELRAEGEVLLELRGKISQMADASERGAAMNALFGRAGRAMAPAFAMSNVEFAKFTKIAEENNAVTEELMHKTHELHTREEELAQMTQVARMRFAEMIAVPFELKMTEWTIAIMKFTQKATEGLKNMWQYLKYLPGFSLIESMRGLFGGDHGEAEGKKNAEMQAEQGERVTKKDVELAEQRVKTELDMRRKQLKADTDYFAEVSRLETGSGVQSVELRRAMFEQMISMAEEEYNRLVAEQQKLVKGGQVPTEILMKLEKDKNDKIQEAQNELRKLMLEGAKARLEDSKKDTEDDILRIRTYADERIRIMEDVNKRELTYNDLSFDTSEKTMLRRYEMEVRFANQTKDAKVQAIDAEIETLKKQAELFKNNADLQRETNNKIIALNKERIFAESDANNKILESRKALVDKLIAEANREAGAAGNLTSRAIANLRARGRESFSQSDIAREIGNIQRRGQDTASTFASGGRVRASAYEEATAAQGSFKDLAAMGSTIGGAMRTMMTMMMNAFTGNNAPVLPSTVTPSGSGFDATSDQFAAATRAQMAAMNAQGGMSASGTTAVQSTATEMTTKIRDAATEAVKGIDFSQVFNAFGAALVRQLELEAQRT